MEELLLEEEELMREREELISLSDAAPGPSEGTLDEEDVAVGSAPLPAASDERSESQPLTKRRKTEAWTAPESASQQVLLFHAQLARR